MLGGRVADLVGRKATFLAGLAVFSVASLAGGLAQSELWLVAARAGQGIGAAFMAPAALSLVMTLYADEGERTKALGLSGAVSGAGGAAGVLAGGTLTELLGWESTLLVNVPIGHGLSVAVLRTVEVHLRADPKLDPRTAQALAEGFRIMYERFTQDEPERPVLRDARRG